VLKLQHKYVRNQLYPGLIIKKLNPDEALQCPQTASDPSLVIDSDLTQPAILSQLKVKCPSFKLFYIPVKSISACGDNSTSTYVSRMVFQLDSKSTTALLYVLVHLHRVVRKVAGQKGATPPHGRRMQYVLV
jgi:hypothetical protein